MIKMNDGYLQKKSGRDCHFVNDHCHLTIRLKTLVHFICILNTRKAHTLIVPKLCQNFSAFDCHVTFQNLFDRCCEKNI